MENSNFIKQAKSDIFKELYTIINFYIKKGAKPQALKKYYRNSKRFNDILEDIKNKGVNLVKDESEYNNLVKQVLNEILDDFIAKEKDEEYRNKKSKMKHIKEFYNFDKILENKNIIQLSEKELRDYLNLPEDCEIKIKKGDTTNNDKYKKYIKYVILNLSSSSIKEIIKKIKSEKPKKYYSHATPNFGKGVNWTVKY